eukprot:TRINITY_DN2505_c0_g1_i3.p2 TRINITY_DN2505_c0_g1~~TRINITY_DN2505_c0_g1_i3.p2  ORF type:complete len:210 (+),score=-23.54 TRINITY_DN2505_c0_g1_i3:358-987(+)
MIGTPGFPPLSEYVKFTICNMYQRLHQQTQKHAQLQQTVVSVFSHIHFTKGTTQRQGTLITHSRKNHQSLRSHTFKDKNPIDGSIVHIRIQYQNSEFDHVLGSLTRAILAKISSVPQNQELEIVDQLIRLLYDHASVIYARVYMHTNANINYTKEVHFSVKLRPKQLLANLANSYLLKLKKHGLYTSFYTSIYRKLYVSIVNSLANIYV